MLKKLLAFFEVVLVVALIILIIAIFTFYISFSKENSLPSVFGNSFFILNTDDMQNENGTGINKGALVIASDNELDSLKEGMVVLCDINDIETAEPVYNVLRIYAIEPNSESTLYTVSNEKMASNRTYIIGKDKIVAKCTYSSDTLGQIIAFSRTTNGIVILIILPCVILIALQIVHLVARAKRNKFEQIELDEFEFPSDMTFPDDEQSPLYNVAKHDFADKVNVEDNFANKNEKQDKKSKKKSAKINQGEIVKASAKSKESQESNDAKLTDTDDVAKKTKKENRKAVTVKLDDTDTVKENAISEEIIDDKKPADKQSITVDDSVKLNKAEEISDNADKNEVLVTEIAQTSDTAINNVQTIKDEEVPVVTEVKVESDDVSADDNEEKAESSENIISAQNTDVKLNDAIESTVSKQIESDTTDNAQNHAKTASDVPKPKKKTTVKRRAPVKRTSSTSATDLLKAIDSESKKLQ